MSISREASAEPGSGHESGQHEPAGSPTTESADYDRRYYESGLGPPYVEAEPHWVGFFGRIADEIIRQLDPRSVLDAGCATGFLVAALAERGVDATGIDVSEYAVDSAVSGAEGRLRVQSLSESLDGRWDLITCIEVLEHMSPAEAQTAIDNLCQATDRILFSSTPHDFNEPSHINVNQVAKWAAWFAQRSFFRRSDLDFSSLSPWALLFERRPMTTADVTHEYELELAPLREELVAKRLALLEANRQISRLEEEIARDTPDLSEDEPGLLAADRVLALVDQVIGLQAELAEDRYRHDREVQAVMERERRLREAADEAKRHASYAAERLNEVLSSRSWRMGQAFIRPAHSIRRLLRRKG